MIGPGHCKPQALIFNGSLDEPPADNIESDCTTVPEVSVEPKVTRASTEAAAIEGIGTGTTAAEYSLYPPERLRTFLYPFPIRIRCARYPRKPTAQNNTMGLSVGTSSIRSLKSSNGILIAPGIVPKENSSAVRVSINITSFLCCTSSRQVTTGIAPLIILEATYPAIAIGSFAEENGGA